MTARLTVTLHCDLHRGEGCHGIVQHPGPSLPMARYLARTRGWHTLTPALESPGQRQDVCPACWRTVGDGELRILDDDALSADAR